jgi:hypothetical protein
MMMMRTDLFRDIDRWSPRVFDPAARAATVLISA